MLCQTFIGLVQDEDLAMFKYVRNLHQGVPRQGRKFQYFKFWPHLGRRTASSPGAGSLSNVDLSCSSTEVPKLYDLVYSRFELLQSTSNHDLTGKIQYLYVIAWHKALKAQAYTRSLKPNQKPAPSKELPSTRPGNSRKRLAHPVPSLIVTGFPVWYELSMDWKRTAAARACELA